jgi:DNA-binding IclR family transcriptional regulator
MGEARVSLAELTSRTGLVKSTVLRIAKSLEKFGYLLRSDEGLYRIGPEALPDRLPVQAPLSLVRDSASGLEAHRRGTSGERPLYILEGDTRICLHRLNPARAVHHLVHEGERLPLTVGAAGHVLRAFSGVRGPKFDEVRHSSLAGARRLDMSWGDAA